MFVRSSISDFSFSAYEATENNPAKRIAFLDALTEQVKKGIEQVEEALIVELPKVMGHTGDKGVRAAAERTLNAFLDIPYHTMNQAWAGNVVEVGADYGGAIGINARRAVERMAAERPDLVDADLLDHVAKVGPLSSDKFDIRGAEQVFGILFKKPAEDADDAWVSTMTRIAATDDWSNTWPAGTALKALVDERPDVCPVVLDAIKRVGANEGYDSAAIQRTIHIILAKNPKLKDSDHDAVCMFKGKENMDACWAKRNAVINANRSDD